MSQWEFVPLLVLALAFPGAVVWVCMLFVRARQRRRELEVLSEFQTRLLDRLESGDELTRFMESPGGERLLKSFQERPARGLDRVLSAATAGLVLTMLGLAAIIVQATADVGGQGFHAIGVMTSGLGLGFLLSAGLSFLLARRYGALNGRTDGHARDAS